MPLGFSSKHTQVDIPIIGYRCSECEFGNTFGKGTIGMNFCPNCGIKLKIGE